MSRDELDQKAWEAGLHLLAAGHPLFPPNTDKTIFDEGYRVAEAYAKTKDARLKSHPHPKPEARPTKYRQ